MSTIAIQNVGPIEHLNIPLAPGVVILRGRNGSGKSYGMKAVQAGIRGKGKLTPRDGTQKGYVEAFGVVVNVARSTRVVGEAEVLSLEGRFDLAQLVDPGLKDEAAADSRRIKSVVALSGVKLTAEDFVGLAADAGEFHNIVSASSKEETDPVTLAERIKRDFEGVARQHEENAKKARAKVAAAREAIDGVDLREESDADTLADDLEAVSAEAARIAATIKERTAAIAERDHAKATIENTKRPDVEGTKAELEKARAAYKASIDDLKAAEDAYREAKVKHTTAISALSAAEKVADSAEQNVTTYDSLAEAANREIPPPPTQQELDDANAEIAVARAAMEQGAVIRRAKEHAADAEEWQRKAAIAETTAERLREAGRGVENILSGAIEFPALKVRSGRLVTEHPTRGEIPYAEMSDGERWKIALDFAIDHVGESGLLVIGQEGWEGLDPDNRAMIANHAAKRGVTILTAESDAGELRAEPLAT